MPSTDWNIMVARCGWCGEEGLWTTLERFLKHYFTEHYPEREGRNPAEFR